MSYEIDTEALFTASSETGGVRSQAPESIRVAHGVVWHAGGSPEPGRLLIEPDMLRLIRGDDVLVLLFATGNASTRTRPLWDLITAGWDENVVKIGIAEQAYTSLDAGERTHAR